jgi:hypothetical protein
MPLGTPELTITGACDGLSWTPNQVDRGKGDTLSLWIAGLPENADSSNLQVYLNSQRVPVTYVEQRSDNQPRQANVKLPAAVPRGEWPVSVKAGQGESSPVPIQVVG